MTGMKIKVNHLQCPRRVHHQLALLIEMPKPLLAQLDLTQILEHQACYIR